MDQQQNIESKAIQESQDLRCKEITRICRKAEQKRLQTRMISESEEQKLYADIQEAKASQERNLAELEQEHKLAQLMADIKHKEIVDLKTNQLIRNNCLELRCAEKQIRTDDATKILLNQIKEKETLKKEEKVRNYYTDLKMLEASKNWFKSEAELQNRKNQMNLDYKNALLDQIKEGTEKQLKLSPIIPTEDQPIDPRENCLKQKNELVECYRKEIEEFTKIKNERKDNERKENDIQDKRIEEYLMEVEKRRRHEEKCKQKKQEEKDTIYNYLVDLKLSATKSCEDSDIQNRLISQQRLNDSWLAAKHEKEMKIQRRDEMINQNEMQLKFKMDQMKKEKENEFIESQKILQSYEQSKIVEAKKYSDKRQSMIEYGNELRKTIEQRSILRDEQKKRLQTNTYE